LISTDHLFRFTEQKTSDGKEETSQPLSLAGSHTMACPSSKT